jgi:hypothetical protein
MQHASSANEFAVTKRWRGTTHAFCTAIIIFHRSVSDGSDDWEYDGSSARDMASFGFLVIASGLIVIVSAYGPLACFIGAELRPLRQGRQRPWPPHIQAISHRSLSRRKIAPPGL